MEREEEEMDRYRDSFSDPRPRILPALLKKKKQQATKRQLQLAQVDCPAQFSFV